MTRQHAAARTVPRAAAPRAVPQVTRHASRVNGGVSGGVSGGIARETVASARRGAARAVPADAGAVELPFGHHLALHYITSHHIAPHYITCHYITLHYITLPGSHAGTASRRRRFVGRGDDDGGSHGGRQDMWRVPGVTTAVMASRP